jgi:hypothetical protein
VAIQEDAGGLRLVICEAQPVGHFYASYRHVKNDIEWARFLDVKGDVSLKAGEMLELQDLPVGFSGPPPSLPDIQVGGQISMRMIRPENSQGPNVSAIFTIPDGGTPESQWLQPDGVVTDEPCPDDGDTL